MKMKRLHKILLPTLFSLTLGLGVVAGITHKTNKPVEEASASTKVGVNGVFKRVTSTTGIKAGDHVLLASITGQVLRNLGGNPAYLYTESDRVNFSSNYEYIFLDNAFVCELVVYTGSKTGSFAFRGEFTTYSTHDYNDYIGYDETGRDHEHPGHPDYYGVGYFKDATGLRRNVDDYSSFYLESYDGEAKFPDDPTLRHMNIKNVGRDDYLNYTSYYDKRFVIAGGDTGVNLYKRLDTSSGSASVYTPPEKTVYDQGDELNLKDLEIIVSTPDIPSDIVAYNGNENLFIHSKYVYGKGATTNLVSFCGFISVNISITVNVAQGVYRKVSSTLSTFTDGNYRIGGACGELGYGVLDLVSYKRNLINAHLVDGVLTIDSEASEPEKGDFTLVKSGNEYVIRNNNSEYIKWYYTGVEYDFRPTDNINEAIKFDLVLENRQISLREHNTDNFIVYTNDFFTLGESGPHATLFRELSDDEVEDYSDYINLLQEKTKACDERGETLAITLEAWGQLEDAFGEMSEFIRGNIASTTYTHNQETYGTLPDLIDRYDYIISKYSQFNDFMGRTTSGAHEDHYHSRANILPTILNSEATPIVIVVSSVSLIAVLALVIYLKKRRTN